MFCLLVWDACHVVRTTCNVRRSLRSTSGQMGTLQAPKQFHGRVLVQWKLQRICILRSLNLGLILPNNTSMVMHFFHMHCSTKSKKNPKAPKFSVLNFLIRRKCVCSIVLAGQYSPNLNDKEFKSHRSVPRSALQVTTSE